VRRKEMKAILFVGHGSRLAAGNDEVRTFIEQMNTRIDEQFLVETLLLTSKKVLQTV